MCKNQFWCELYSPLNTFRLNILKDSPEEHIYIPINREPLITKNRISIQQHWSKSKIIGDILELNGGVKEINMKH